MSRGIREPAPGHVAHKGQHLGLEGAWPHCWSLHTALPLGCVTSGW